MRKNAEHGEGKKVIVHMRIAVHPLQAKLWEARHRITPDMSLRQIARLIGVPSASPQKIKHHLQRMVTMGAIDYIGGQYVFPERVRPTF